MELLDESPIEILLIEDSPVIVALVEKWLGDGINIPFRLEHADTLSAGMERLSRKGIQLIVLDLNLSDSKGLETFLRVHAAAKDIPIVVLTGTDNEELALMAVKEGAQDYVVKTGMGTNPLARAVRFAIERDKRLRAERELIAAEQLQATLYPRQPPNLPGFDVAGAAYSAAEMCGDYFDFIPMPDDTLAVVVGDVSGHGLGPALKMTETRAYLRAISRAWELVRGMAESNLDLGEILTYSNQLLAEQESVHFIKLFLACINPQERLLTFAAAGHRAFLLNASGGVTYLETNDPVLGAFEEMAMTRSPPIKLSKGDLILIATDGFDESMGDKDELFGIDRTLDVVRANRQKPASEIIQTLYEAARGFAQGTPQSDDMAAIVIKVEE